MNKTVSVLTYSFGCGSFIKEKNRRGDRKMFGKWLIFFFVSVAGLSVFQWVFYSGLDWAKTRTMFGHTFISPLGFYLTFSALISVVMIVPNAIVFYISNLAFNEWFGRAWVLYLTFSAASAVCSAFIFWYKFSELPSGGTAIALGLYFAAAVISAVWR